MTAPVAAPEDLAATLAPLERWLLVLDFDGTLSPIVDEPAAARPAPGAVEAVGAVAQRTRVAVVSGRPVAELRARLGDLPAVLAGGHGAEIVTPEGEHARMVDPAAVQATLAAVADELAPLLRPDEGWEVETKDTSLAVHHRRVAPVPRDSALSDVRSVLHAHTDDPPGFEVLAGKAVDELRARGVDKGAALAWIADRAPGLKPLAVGDDVTDEDAFREAVGRGGTAVLVADDPRPTAAEWRLPDPDAVVGLLRAMTAGA